MSTFPSSLLLLLLNPPGGTCFVYLFLQGCVMLSDKPQIQTWCSSIGVTVWKVEFGFSSRPQPAFTFINTGRWNIDLMSWCSTCACVHVCGCKCSMSEGWWCTQSSWVKSILLDSSGASTNAYFLLSFLYRDELDLTRIRPGSNPDLTCSGLCALNMIEIHSASPSDETFNLYPESRNSQES